MTVDSEHDRDDELLIGLLPQLDQDAAPVDVAFLNELGDRAAAEIPAFHDERLDRPVLRGIRPATLPARECCSASVLPEPSRVSDRFSRQNLADNSTRPRDAWDHPDQAAQH